MAKRSSSSQSAITRALTGGTGDVNPNIFRFATLTSTALGSSERVVAATPLNAFNNVAGNRATVMEVLKVFFTNRTTFSTGLGQSFAFMNFMLASSRNVAAADVQQGWAAPQCVGYKQIRQNIQATGSTLSEPNGFETSWEVDVTDGAGHGILIAGPEVEFVTLAEVIGAATMSASTRQCAFLYRFKDVPLQEYMGILASNQVNQ